MKILSVFILASFIYLSQGRPQSEATTVDENEVTQEEYSVALSAWISELINHVSAMIHAFMEPLVSEIEYAHEVIEGQDHYINMLEEHLYEDGNEEGNDKDKPAIDDHFHEDDVKDKDDDVKDKDGDVKDEDGDVKDKEDIVKDKEDIVRDKDDDVTVDDIPKIVL